MTKKFAAIVVVLSLVLASSSAFAASRTKVKTDTVYEASKYTRVEVYYPGESKPDVFVLEEGDPSVTVYAGSEVVLTKRTAKVKRAAQGVKRAKQETTTPTPEVTTQSDSNCDQLLAQYGRGNTANGSGVTITGGTTTTSLATSNVDGGFVGKAATAPMGLKAEIRKYGFQVVDVDLTDERLPWAVNFCKTVDPGAKVYATSEGCLVVWHANSGLISGAKKCTLDRNAPVSVDYDAGGKGGHAEPGQSFRYTGRITVRY